jgi:cellulose synthase/poly-beta-1,6-N-acetylglucosamine synthase-like glycosyltransferase
MTVLLGASTILSAGLVVWHLAAWPVLLRRLTKDPEAPPPLDATHTASWPSIAIIIPAHNEARWIGEKIANIGALDYPADRLRLVIALDGCTDDTRARAEAALAAREAAHLRAEIVENPRNIGKLATLDRRIREASEDIIALSDASAILSLDTLTLAAAHFAYPSLGAVGGAYVLFAENAESEAGFWSSQTAVKRAEAAIGAPMGLHGAFYAFRRSLYEPLPHDTINDDFSLPMSLVERGWRVAYEPRINAVELEGSSVAMDFRRRRRIGAGNMQQSLRHWRLLDPRRPGVALAFASGKGVRPLIPAAMLLALIGSIVLSPASPLFAAAAAAQAAAYLSVGIVASNPHARWPEALRAVHYVVTAQLASGLGGLEYLMGRWRGPWGRVSAGPAATEG